MENLDYTNSFEKEQMFTVREILVKMPEIKKKHVKVYFTQSFFFCLKISNCLQLASMGSE